MKNKFLTVQINSCLSLTDDLLQNDMNIDLLSKSLQNSDLPLQNKLNIATTCVNLCEKFHSYFHYEQSYFHLLLAKHLSDENEKNEQLEKAIFQDPLNHEAKSLLNCRLIEKKYERDLQSFKDFLFFVGVKENISIHTLQNSYWSYFEKYQQTNDIEFLKKALDTIAEAHKNYHTNAAKIYYNRHIIFYELGNEILGKNDLVKTKNLDSSIAKHLK